MLFIDYVTRRDDDDEKCYLTVFAVNESGFDRGRQLLPPTMKEIEHPLLQWMLKAGFSSIHTNCCYLWRSEFLIAPDTPIGKGSKSEQCSALSNPSMCLGPSLPYWRCVCVSKFRTWRVAAWLGCKY